MSPEESKFWKAFGLLPQISMYKGQWESLFQIPPKMHSYLYPTVCLSIHMSCVSQCGVEHSCALPLLYFMLLRDRILSLLQPWIAMSSIFTFKWEKNTRYSFWKKKKGLVKYKILLLFRSVIAAAVFEIFIFLLYIMNNMDSGHTALTPLPFFGDCHKYFRIRGFILICLIQIIFIFGKTKSE